MSEFKFVCPVCGQHMICDSSQGGSVMECPTCFQKVIAPQAPAPDAKFILTGTKLTEKKIPARRFEAATGPAAPPQKFPAALLVVVLLLALAAGAGIYFYGGKIFRFGPAAAWQTQDIGNVHAPGSFKLVNGVFTITGDGADIWDQADSFHYVFKALAGDVTLTARVLNLKNTNPWAKAGVMVRESLAADSPYAVAVVTPAAGITFQQRDRPAGPASSVIVVPNLTAPYWVRLVREGNSFTAYSSENGTEWDKMGATTILMSRQAYAGLAVCAHEDGTLCPAQFDHVTWQTNSGAGRAAAPPAPKLVAPPANDTNWTLTPDEAAIPDSTAAGRIHGQDFIIERAYFQNGILTLRAGSRGPVEFGVQINFSGAQPASLAGQTINVSAEADKAAPVTLHWPDTAGVQKEKYDVGYALRLGFGPLEKNRLPGKIYLCTPDAEKSYLLGKFNASVIKPRPPKPQ